MPRVATNASARLAGHALRNAHLRQRAVERARDASPLSRLVVTIRAEVLGLTRLECARRCGISRGALRDLELGVHQPTRQTLQQFLTFCRQQHVPAGQLDELQCLYVGPGENLEQFLGRLELRAGSARKLAQLVDISATTLWEYRRGSFPLPLALLRRMCAAVGEDAAAAEALWGASQRRRLLERGLPPAWAELCLLCARDGQPESHLLRLGVRNTTFRRLRYLELPPWGDVAAAARRLCRDDCELQALQKLWQQGEHEQQRLAGFGPYLKQLRERQGVTRRELADLFGVGGKKPARILKHVEEDGLYSAQAYPAGLVAVLTDDLAERARLLDLWQQRRAQFHRRRRPETRVELRLVREQYGFALGEMEALLGYTSLEYQKIERGVSPLLDSARKRIVQALHAAGQRRVAALLEQRRAQAACRAAWKAPATVEALITSLADREGGLLPLARLLKHAGLRGLWIGRLRSLLHCCDLPAWPVLEQLALACGVEHLVEVREDWAARYRAQTQERFASPLAVELRCLIAEKANTLRDLSPKLGFNYSVLVREFQRIDRDEPLRWFHVERLLRVLGLPPDCERWKQIRALWSTVRDRNKPPPAPRAEKLA
jgi:transcriptional regulator with XRE-family HTH domain